MDWKEYIGSDNDVLVGKPTIKGTRISVEFVIQLLASGWTELQILENYPRLKSHHLQAVFSYIYESIHDNLVYNYSRQTA